MKKLLWLLPILFLCGCAAQPAMETVSDVYAVPASVAGYTLSLQLPEAAAQFTMEEPGGSKLFQCQGYTVTVQELESGDLARTVRAVTGQDMEHLTVLTTRQGEWKRHAFAWTAAGEGTQQICRTVILDDGRCHHALTVMADHALAGQLASEWEHIFSTATLVSTG